MKLRIVSACLALVLVLSLCSGFTAFAAQGELPETLTLRAAEGNGIPSWIDLTPDPAGTKDAYHLYLPGNVVPEACFLSWEGGLSATLEGKSYESGALPIPKPGQSATYSFTAGAQSKTFTVRCYQGSAAVKPIFIEIDESLGTIAAMNGDKDHETTCSGIIYVDGVQMTLSKMKGRGNYTWDHAVEKRPYNITLGKKTVLLGIDTPQTKKWSLLANTNDHTLLRNKVAYDLAHTMGIGQDSATADMWMNGQYQGTYLVTPKTDSFVPDDGFMVENNNYAETVPISEGGDPTFYVGSSNESVSAGSGGGGGWGGWGGFIPGQPGYSGSTLLTNIKEIGKNWLEGGVENTETITDAAKRIRAYLEDAWAAIQAADGKNSKGKYYADYMDLPSTAAFYLLHEFVKNLEVEGGSIFFHRDGMTDDDKLMGGPAWDYDNALGFNGTNFFGGGSKDNYLRIDGWYITGKNRSGLFGKLGTHQDLLDETKAVYNRYYRAFDDVSQNVQRQADLIADSAEMNFARFTKETMNAFDFDAAKTYGSGDYAVTYKATETWRDYIDNLKAYTAGRARYFKDQMYVAPQEEGFDAIFQLGSNCGVTVYDTQDLAGEGRKNPDVVYARNSATGEIDTSGEGQINFVVDLKDGWSVKEINVLPVENFKNLKGPSDTGTENAYRVTKVSGPLTIQIVTDEFVCEHEFEDGVCVHCGAVAPKITFACDPGASVDVALSQAADSERLENVTVAYPRGSASGEIDISGDGQVNFVVRLQEGYTLASVTAEPTGSFRNLKTPDETKVENGYRVTKITADLTVTIHTEFSGPVQPELDKTGLEKAIQSAEALDLEAYTPESAKNLEQALAAAKKALDEAKTQDELDQAAITLLAAIADLEPKPEEPVLDKAPLEKAIEEAEKLDADKYTDETAKALAEAIEAAKKALEEAKTQDELDDAKKALDDAVKALVEKPDEPTPTPTPIPTPTPTPHVCPGKNFTDMPAVDYWSHAPIDWAIVNKITVGTSDTTFGPTEGCTRAQVVTFLWRAAKEPAPTSKENPFKDVKESDYFYNAVLWAVEKGITVGTDPDKFSPGETCTRAQIVTFLYRYEGKPEVKPDDSFTDVKPGDYFADSVAWAVANGITVGTDPGKFSPSDTCTREQVVTFLYRDIAE